MIHANFGGLRHTAISGAYQYDTGQRIKMRGLPSPAEMLERDDLLSGEEAALQVHYAHEDDSQAEMRLAKYNAAEDVWTADVPDEYLVDSEPVRVYVYVSFGESGEESRTETVYEGVFTPIRRPAPNNVATQDQWDAWALLQNEVEMAITTTNTAADNALDEVSETQKAAASLATPTQDAKDAHDAAEDAHDSMLAMETAWTRTQISKTDLAPGSVPTISVSKNESGTREIVLGIPTGADGTDGAKGDTGPADIQFVLDGTTLYTTTTT